VTAIAEIPPNLFFEKTREAIKIKGLAETTVFFSYLTPSRLAEIINRLSQFAETDKFFLARAARRKKFLTKFVDLCFNRRVFFNFPNGF
jgi:hypothetical protein